MENSFEPEGSGPVKRGRLSIIALLLVLLCGAMLFFLFKSNGSGTATPTPSPAPTPGSPALDPSFSGLSAYILDVGQGDCIFLRSPSDKTMLVDAGPAGSFGIIRRFLKQQQVERLDVVVATHLHADHIGSMEEIISNWEVGAFYMTPFDTESSTYASLLSALEQRHITPVPVYADVDVTLPWDDWCQVQVLSPYKASYKEENDTSLMLRVSYLKTAILLAGDAGALAERLAVKALPNHLLKSNVLKVGHHGSDSATTGKFLSAVAPQIAVISCGRDNSYGFPDEGVLNRLSKAGATVWRTDLSGTVLVALDGASAWVVE